MRRTISGFTLVELLITIVILGILASISVVAFNGVQLRARDAQRDHDISVITKALEMYYSEHSSYPLISGTYNWTPTATMDRYIANTFVLSSWAELESHLSIYLNQLGTDPKNQRGPSGIGHSGRYAYEYKSNPNAEQCNVPRRTGQTYTLYFKYEGRDQTHSVTGNCTYLRPSGTTFSTYTVVK